MWRASRVVSGIRADTVSDERPRVDRRGLYAIGGRLYVPLLGCPTIIARDVCYVDVRAVWRVSRVSRVVSGIRADTVSDEQPNVDRRGLSEIERRLYVPSIGRHFIVARNVCYVDVRALWRVSRVVSGIEADIVSDVLPHVDRRGLWRASRGTALLLHVFGRQYGSFARALHFCRVWGLFRRRPGGAILLPCRQRHLDHHRCRYAAPCRLTRVGEILA